METKLIAGNAAEIETECLVVVALDHGDKRKSDARLAHRDVALEKSAAELLSTGEVTSKQFEAALLHHPQGLKAQRLLVVMAARPKTSISSICAELPGRPFASS